MSSPSLTTSRTSGRLPNDSMNLKVFLTLKVYKLIKAALFDSIAMRAIVCVMFIGFPFVRSRTPGVAGEILHEGKSLVETIFLVADYYLVREFLVSLFLAKIKLF